MITENRFQCHTYAFIVLNTVYDAKSSMTRRQQQQALNALRQHLSSFLTLLLSAMVMCSILLVGATSASAGMIRDAEIEAALEGLIAPLEEAAGYTRGTIKIRVILNNQYNAFVAGTHTVYVHSGLIKEADGVLEFLGVMAHEIGHIREGHVQRLDEAAADAGATATLATIAALAVAAGGSGDAAAGVLFGGTDQATRGYLATRRRDEAVADEIAMSLLEQTELSATGIRDQMQRMARQRSLPESRQSIYYSTHPGSGERLQAFQDHVDQSEFSNRPAPPSAVHLYDRARTKVTAWTEAPQRILSSSSPLSDTAEFTVYARAIAHYRRGALDKALALMDQLLANHSDDAFFHEFRGDILFAKANPEAAADAYEASLSLRKHNPLVQLNLGRALIATGKDDNLPKAVMALEFARRGEPKWAFVHRTYGIALGKSGRLAEADLALADEALLIGDRGRAIQLAKRVLKSPDLEPLVHSRASDILFRYGADAAN